mgnify:CR=1 FL=1
MNKKYTFFDFVVNTVNEKCFSANITIRKKEEQYHEEISISYEKYEYDYDENDINIMKNEILQLLKKTLSGYKKNPFILILNNGVTFKCDTMKNYEIATLKNFLKEYEFECAIKFRKRKK